VARQIARELGIVSRISTLGVRSDVRVLMPGFDVLGLTSAWGETFSLAAGEAMASGVAAVVTNVGDCAVLVGDTGMVVPPRDTAALTAALASVLDMSPEARRELGARARRRVMENFSLQQYVAKHQTLYESALAHSPQRQPTLTKPH
jgi:glycosyltransferase involved in cell wall biosynthesis